MTMPADGLRAFGPIIGRWATPGVVFDDRGAATRTIAGAEEYAWVGGGHWVVHRIDVVIVDQHSQGRELIGDCDAGTGRYRMRAFDASGSVSTMTALPRADGCSQATARGPS